MSTGIVLIAALAVIAGVFVDWLLRGQAFTPPSTGVYVALFTAAPTDAGGGTEVAGNGYARVSVANSLAAWAGTQAAASTTASSGTNGTTSNNATISFPTPTPAGWGTVVAFGVFDAATLGNLLFYAPLTVSKTINAGDAVTFAAGALSLQIDN